MGVAKNQTHHLSPIWALLNIRKSPGSSGMSGAGVAAIAVFAFLMGFAMGAGICYRRWCANGR